MSETSELTGSLLGADVWAVLAHEYLTGGRSNVPGVEALGRYVCDHVVEFVPSGLDGVQYRHDGVQWAPVAGQPYEGLADLSAEVWAGSARVSTDYCDHPVWSPDTNVRFRIWHDTAHVRCGLGFGVDDELRLFVHQAREIDRNSSPSWRAIRPVIDALFCESVYQLAAFVAGGGQYPEQQFVTALGPVGRAVQDLLFVLL